MDAHGRTTENGRRRRYAAAHWALLWALGYTAFGLAGVLGGTPLLRIGVLTAPATLDWALAALGASAAVLCGAWLRSGPLPVLRGALLTAAALFGAAAFGLLMELIALLAGQQPESWAAAVQHALAALGAVLLAAVARLRGPDRPRTGALAGAAERSGPDGVTGPPRGRPRTVSPTAGALTVSPVAGGTGHGAQAGATGERHRAHGPAPVRSGRCDRCRNPNRCRVPRETPVRAARHDRGRDIQAVTAPGPRLRTAAVAGTVAFLPYAAMKLHWATGGTFAGISGAELRAASRRNGASELWLALESRGIDVTVLLAGLGLLLLWGLVRPWGLVFPRWVPGLRGRRVPRALPLVPAVIGAASLLPYGVLGLAYCALAQAGAVEMRAGDFPTGADALTAAWPGMIAFGGYGVALAVAARSYWLRTRPGAAAE
ncbi:hypothetical protein ACWDR0_19430 [Streptomyces sp. NPDC003691]